MLRIIQSTYFVGVDLGQRRDHTAIAVVECSTLIRDERDPVTFAFLEEKRMVINALEQLPLGIPYPTIVGYLEKLVRSNRLWDNCLLAVDATGVGQPVYDLLRNCRLRVRGLRAVHITAGERASREGQIERIPRRLLLHNLHARTIGRDFKICGGLPHAKTLLRELAQLQVRIDDAGNEYIAPAEHSQHDDLVFAAAIALWFACQPANKGTIGAVSQGPLF